MAPSFAVPGDPAALRSSATRLRATACRFAETGDALARVSTDGWSGAAADDFRDAFSHEPQRWEDAAAGFSGAAAALESHATVLEEARATAQWAAQEYARGERVTREARAAYDADVARARQEAADAAARGQFRQLLIHPFSDPGEAVRRAALDVYTDTVTRVEASGLDAASAVRRACNGAPEQRNWLEKAGAAVGGFLLGAGEAVRDLGKLVLWDLNPQAQLVWSGIRVATGQAEIEEIQAEWQLADENLQNLVTAAREDPVGLGQHLGKAMLDWDTWKDDPARALGRLVPDALATVATGGAGAGVKALRALDGIHEVSAFSRPLHGLRALRGVTALDLAGLGRLDDAALAAKINSLTSDQQALLLRRGEDYERASLADVFGPHAYDTDYNRIASTWQTGPRVDADTVPVDGPLVNLHGRGDAGSGMYWTDPAELLTARREDQALDRLALRDEWYMHQDADGALVYRARDEITVRHFPGGEGMRMQVGTIGPQKADVEAWLSKNPDSTSMPTHRPDGTEIPSERPGGATQYVAGLNRPAYETPVASWTGPAPWVEDVPQGARIGFAAGGTVGALGSITASGAAQE